MIVNYTKLNSLNKIHCNRITLHNQISQTTSLRGVQIYTGYYLVSWRSGNIWTNKYCTIWSKNSERKRNRTSIEYRKTRLSIVCLCSPSQLIARNHSSHSAHKHSVIYIPCITIKRTRALHLPDKAAFHCLCIITRMIECLAGIHVSEYEYTNYKTLSQALGNNSSVTKWTYLPSALHWKYAWFIVDGKLHSKLFISQMGNCASSHTLVTFPLQGSIVNGKHHFCVQLTNILIVPIGKQITIKSYNCISHHFYHFHHFHHEATLWWNFSGHQEQTQTMRCYRFI